MQIEHSGILLDATGDFCLPTSYQYGVPTSKPCQRQFVGRAGFRCVQTVRPKNGLTIRGPHSIFPLLGIFPHHFSTQIINTIQNVTKGIEVHTVMFCSDTHRTASINSSKKQKRKEVRTRTLTLLSNRVPTFISLALHRAHGIVSLDLDPLLVICSVATFSANKKMYQNIVHSGETQQVTGNEEL